MSTFPLRILTPQKDFFSGEVERVIVHTTEGDVGILAKHEKYVAVLPSGPMKVTLADGTERLAALAGGAIKVSPDRTAIFADAVEWAADIDLAWAKNSEEDARRKLSESKTRSEQRIADAKLKRAQNRLRVAEMAAAISGK